MPLNRDQIVQAKDLDSIVLQVPEWGGEVRLAQFSAEAAASIEPQDSLAHMVAMSVVDEDGNLLFDGPDQLKKKSAKVMKRIFDAVVELNGLSSASIENLAKN